MSKHKSLVWLSVAFLAACMCATAQADTVTMKNGDVISGKIVSMKDDGEIVMESMYMGTVMLPTSEVTAIRTDAAVTVEAAGGSRFVGTLNYDANTNAVIETQAGRVTIAPADFLAINPGEKEAAAPKWTGAFEAGVSGQSGNKETFRGNAKLTVERAYEDLALSGYASGRYAQEDGTVSENQQRAGGRAEMKIDDMAFWYTAIDLERDEFKQLVLRTSAVVGVGRAWWKDGDNYWKTRAGLGFTHESYENTGDDIYPSAELASEYGKRLSKSLTFTDQTRFLLDLADFKGWKGENDAALAMALTEDGSWALKLGLMHQYDNTPAAGVDRLDTYYYLNAVKSF